MLFSGRLINYWTHNYDPALSMVLPSLCQAIPLPSALAHRVHADLPFFMLFQLPRTFLALKEIYAWRRRLIFGYKILFDFGAFGFEKILFYLLQHPAGSPRYRRKLRYASICIYTVIRQLLHTERGVATG